MRLSEFASALWQAGVINVTLTLASFPLAVAVACVAAAVRIGRVPVLAAGARAYVDAVRMTPLLLHLFFVFFALPKIGISFDAWTAAVITIAVHFGAYQAEVVRSAYESVPEGLHEAADTLGMGRLTRLRRVTLPVAVRVAIPPLTNTLIEMFRGTAVVSLVAIQDIVFTSVLLTNQNRGSSPELFALVALFFIVICVPAQQLLRILERRVALPS